MSHTHCVGDCGREFVPRGTRGQLPEGMTRHVARGLCTMCWKRQDVAANGPRPWKRPEPRTWRESFDVDRARTGLESYLEARARRIAARARRAAIVGTL